jgi:hypothetical protein
MERLRQRSEPPQHQPARRTRRGESARLPYTAWTQTDTVEDGGWGECLVEPVVVPAMMGLDKGVWYQLRQGIRGLLAHDEDGNPCEYVLCEPASHYYQIMTRGSTSHVIQAQAEMRT